MSRAFVKEDSDAPEPGPPERPVSGLPNWVTPRGMRVRTRCGTRRTPPSGSHSRADISRSISVPWNACSNEIRTTAS